MSAGMMTNTLVSAGVAFAEENTINKTQLSSNTNKSDSVKATDKYEKPVLESPYIYQTDLKGRTTPNTDVLISDYEGFDGYVTTHSDSLGNFTATSSLINNLTKHTPGTTLYVKAGDTKNENYGEAETTLIHYPTPKVNETYAYDTEIKGTAYPNSRVFISDSDFGGYVTVEVDSSGNFTAPVSLLKALTDYESGNTLYFKSSESDIYSQAVSLTSSTKITENQSSITANDFTLEYGADFNDQIAIEKAGATATDANGNEEGVKVKESNVDTSKPGEYSVTFISDSGKEKTVKVTVKEAAKKADTPVFNQPYYYNNDLKGKTSPNAYVDIRINAPGETDFTVQADGNGNFTVPSETLKKYSGYQVGKTIYATASFGTTETTSSVAMVTIESQPEILTVDPVYEDSEYITGTLTKGYTGAIIAYDSNNNIVAVAGQNESTNGTFKLAIQRKPVPGEKLTIKNFDSEGVTIIKGKQITVQERNVAPTLQSEKEIHVPYGSEWSDEIAKEQAKVKATDGKGNDVTKDVVVTSNPVDTTKPGSYTVEFSITEDGLTSTSQTTVVVDEAIAPTIESEKEIHVAYGSEWDDELAKEQAKVKATDGQGNDVTKDVVVTSNPVDTTKPGSYTVEFSITKDGLTSTSQTIVIVDEQEKDYLLEPNEYVIGKDAYVTGKAGEDVKFVALYKEENGKRVFYKRAPVADGQIKVYASGLITDKDQVIYAVAEDENHQTITVDGQNVEKQVTLSELGEGVDYQLSPDEYVLGTHYITGVYDNDQADRLRLRVDGKIVNTIYPDQSSNQFKMYASSVTSTDQKVDVLEYQGDELLTIKPVTIKEAQEITYNLSANDYNMGDAYVTGTYDNEYADTVKLIVDGKVVKLTHPDSSQTSYKLAASSFIDSVDQEVVIAEYNGSKELTRVNVNVTQPKTYEITPDTFELGKTSLVTGTWNSDDDSIKYINLYVNDQRVSINALNEDGTFSISTKNTIKAPTDKVELQLADASKIAIGEKVPVTVQKSDYQLSLNDYTLNDTKVTGTFDSRYTTNKDQLQLVIDGKVAKQVVYSETDTAPGKENEEFAIVAKGLITDKNQQVIVRHIKDGKKVVEQNLTIQ